MNGDGDTSDRVLQVFDTETGKLTNVKQAAADLVVGAQQLVAFRTPEASQGVTDLNGDGDKTDNVLQVFDAATGGILNSEQAVTPCRLEACDPRVPYRVLNDTVRFLTLECDQHGSVISAGCPTGGTDLNGDGDADDLVVQVLNVRQACHNGSPAGACHTLASVSAGVCTNSGQACASNDACGAGSTCFTPPGGCIKHIGGSCNPNPNGLPSGCLGSQFCQPILGGGGAGECKELQGPCTSDSDCTSPAECNNSDQNFQRLMAPFSKPEISGEVFTSTGRCVEDFGTACSSSSDCKTSEFCEAGTCHRRYDVCAKDADCAPGSVCKQDLDRAAVNDTDNDELPDLFDNCPTVANIMQEDSDGNGVGDACEHQLIGGDKLMIKDRDGEPAVRKIVLISKDPSVVSPPPKSGADPTKVGAQLRLYNPGTGEDAVFALPAARWKGLGRPAGIKGYKYTDKDFVDGPCKKVIIKPGTILKAVCKGDQIGFSLDEPQQGSVAVRLVTGSSGTPSSYCLNFGGQVLADEPATGGNTGVFKAKDAQPPSTCPVP
ncbi:MAG TPA: thrombospondin type 3 repeat-containing protein [Mycobacterium sp.]|nr:thrombospondin type 3 repeat-containing protein [Mycobacterium sp.]